MDMPTGSASRSWSNEESWSADITGDIGVNRHAMPIRNKGVLHWLARIDAVPVDLGLSRLGQDCIAGQFCAVVANNRLGLATRGN
jgi:hypothetical protein